MTRALLALLFALPLAACGGRVDLLPEEPTSDAGVDAPTAPCDAASCAPAPGGCVKSSDCGADFYCEVKAGACGAPGTCVKKPDSCDTLYAPVCGCDGKTYGNECSAKMSGATISYKGSCAPSASCGGTSGATCAAGLFCKLPDGACDSDGAGSCAPIPSGCADLYAPVCGCDGKTYGNPCEAASARQNVAYKGACGGDTPAQVCGGLAESVCPSSMYCDFPTGSFCGGDDSSGVCRPRPTGCTKENRPVCGCDRRTYGNPCQAAMAGVDVAKEGGC